jgi:hypothetical protein
MVRENKIYRLDKLPAIQIVKTPKLTREQDGLLKKAEEAIAANPHFFNGEIFHVKKAEKSSLSIFKSTFAWSLVKEGMLPTLGSLGISLALRDNKKYLWQKRSKHVLLPGLWDFAAGGHVESPDILQEIRKEAREEIKQNNLEDLAAEYLLIQKSGKVDLLFSARWSGEKIKGNEEIESLVWKSAPPGKTPEAVNLLLPYLNNYQ